MIPSGLKTILPALVAASRFSPLLREQFNLVRYQECRLQHEHNNYQHDLAVHNVYEGRECRLGDFEILRLIASGGTADVYEAIFRQRYAVALKVLRRERGRGPSRVFAAEECAVANLQHWAVPKFYCSLADDGTRALAFELLNGQDGVDYVLHAERRQLSAEQFLSVLRVSASLFDLLHRSGVVYRDYKPDNVMFLPNGEVKIIDFGFLEPIGSETHLSGTLEYIAPEYLPNALDGPLGIAAPAQDWYALGVSLFVLVNGWFPFYEDRPEDLIQAVQQGLDAADLPRGPVGQLIYGLLIRVPEQRWGKREIRDWLRTYASDISSLDYPTRTIAADGEQRQRIKHLQALAGLGNSTLFTAGRPSQHRMS